MADLNLISSVTVRFSMEEFKLMCLALSGKPLNKVQQYECRDLNVRILDVYNKYLKDIVSRNDIVCQRAIALLNELPKPTPKEIEEEHKS